MPVTKIKSRWSGGTLIFETTDGDPLLELDADGTLTLNAAAIVMSDLPTSDPSVAGQVWSNTNVLTVSAG